MHAEFAQFLWSHCQISDFYIKDYNIVGWFKEEICFNVLCCTVCTICSICAILYKLYTQDTVTYCISVTDVYLLKFFIFSFSLLFVSSIIWFVNIDANRWRHLPACVCVRSFTQPPKRKKQMVTIFCVPVGPGGWRGWSQGS